MTNEIKQAVTQYLNNKVRSCETDNDYLELVRCIEDVEDAKAFLGLTKPEPEPEPAPEAEEEPTEDDDTDSELPF
jgi:hypothetical protein